jgi:pseudaminic acid cytidylyltransferase
MNEARRIAIIPARAGSKRLPGKNLRIFHGKPIVHYTVEAGIQSNCFDKIIVSSDSSEILNSVSSFNVSLHERSSSLASDEARVVDVCERVILEESNIKNQYDQICVLYATAPMRTASDICSVVGLLDRSDCNYAIATTHYSHYPFQALKAYPNNFVKPMWPHLATKRSNEIGELIAGNGSTYAAKTNAFCESKEFYGEGMRYHLMPKSRSVDIDTEEDWKLAESLYLDNK